MKKDYKQYCEEIYQKWLNDPLHLSTFDSYFNITYLPEPYFTVRSPTPDQDERKLIVMNNNPGGVLDFQHHSKIVANSEANQSFADIAKMLNRAYIPSTGGSSTEQTGKKSGWALEHATSAKSRLNKIETLAEILGYNSIETVEAFYLHSHSFKKYRYLKLRNPEAPKKIDSLRKGPSPTAKELISEYEDCLTRYLENQAVIAITAVGTKKGLTKSFPDNDWAKYQADLMGLNTERTTFTELISKNGKTTAAVYHSENKWLFCMMGSNNLPSLKYLEDKKDVLSPK